MTYKISFNPIKNPDRTTRFFIWTLCPRQKIYRYLIVLRVAWIESGFQNFPL